MGIAEKWFRRIVWIGILLNLCSAIPAMFALDMLLAALDLPPAASMLWLQNVGMLLLTLCIFYTPSAVSPARYPVHTSWWCCRDGSPLSSGSSFCGSPFRGCRAAASFQ